MLSPRVSVWHALCCAVLCSTTAALSNKGRQHTVCAAIAYGRVEWRRHHRDCGGDGDGAEEAVEERLCRHACGAIERRAWHELTCPLGSHTSHRAMCCVVFSASEQTAAAGMCVCCACFAATWRNAKLHTPSSLCNTRDTPMLIHRHPHFIIDHCHTRTLSRVDASVMET